MLDNIIIKSTGFRGGDCNLKNIYNHNYFVCMKVLERYSKSFYESLRKIFFNEQGIQRKAQITCEHMRNTQSHW